MTIALKLEGTEEGDVALAALHARGDEHVKRAGLSLLTSSKPTPRGIGSRILRGFCDMTTAPHDHSAEFIDALRPVIEREDDEYALICHLHAIGAHVHPLGLDILCQHANDPRPAVRETIADKLCVYVYRWPEDADKAIQLMIQLASDPEPSVAGSTLWDVAEYPDLFTDFADGFIAAAQQHLKHTGRAGEDAKRVIEVLSNHL